MDTAQVRARANQLPAEPGVYRFLDPDGHVLYVGKSARLCDRVANYATADQGPRKADMVERAASVDVFATTTEREALILENTLIKRHKPPYNAMMSDDKTHPFIALSRDDVPRIFKTRDRNADAEVFGPFPNESGVKHLMRAIREAFGIRDCKTMLPQGCIKHELGLCIAPCMLDVHDEYAANVDAVRRLLRGDAAPAIEAMRARMDRSAANLDFERAALWRDRITRVQDAMEKQAVFSKNRRDRDAVAIATVAHVSAACVVHERDGRVVGKDVIRLVGGAEDDEEQLERVVTHHYAGADPPAELLLPTELPGAAALAEVLSERRGSTVRVRTPTRGAVKRLVEIAERNARIACREVLVTRGNDASDEGLDQLRRELRLPELPRRIECIDVSHLSGREVVGSVVTLVDGRPEKRAYRHYKVSTQQNDDYAAVHEVVTRRYTRLIQEDRPLPDLVVIDGGPGQVNAAMAALAELTVEVPLIGLAKRFEEIHRPNSRFPVRLPRDSPGLHVLQRARDEAHRFAVRYGRTLRRRKLDRSPLDDVPGVGPVLKKRLLKEFGGLAGVRKASEAELEAVEGVGPAVAKRVRAVLGRR